MSIWYFLKQCFKLSRSVDESYYWESSIYHASFSSLVIHTAHLAASTGRQHRCLVTGNSKYTNCMKISQHVHRLVFSNSDNFKKKMKKERAHISVKKSNQTDEILTQAPLTPFHKQIICTSSSSLFNPKLSMLCKTKF